MKPTTKRNPDLAGWCGHFDVDLRTWRCPDDDTPLPAAARARLEHLPTIAPAGWVWVLDWAPQEATDETDPPLILGVFSDRATIARRYLRGRICGADRIRAIHWYQNVLNGDLSGWDEDLGEPEDMYVFSLRLIKIDDVG